MDSSEHQNRTENGFHENVYHTGSGFYNPYIEPLWKKERRMLRSAGNGIGLAAIFYFFLSYLGAAALFLFVELFYPYAYIHGNLYVTETTEWLFSLGSYVLTLAVPFGLYMLFTRIPIRVAIPFRKAKTGLTVGGIFVSLACGVLGGYLVTYLESVLGFFGIEIFAPETVLPGTIPGTIIYVIAVTVVPAFVEEIIFHGIIMQNLRRFGDLFALIVSTLIFAAFHLNLVQGVYSFICGLCIGYFVMRTGSLWVGVAAHLINNAVVVIFDFLEPHLSYESFFMANSVYNLAIVLLAVIFLVLILLKYKDMFRFEPSRISLSPGKKSLYFSAAPFLVIAAVFAFITSLQYISFF